MHLSMLPGHFHQHFLTRLTPQSLAFLLSRLPSTRTIQLQATSWRPRTWCKRGLSSPTPLRRDRGSTCIASAWSRLQKRGARGCLPGSGLSCLGGRHR
jgi:hypothetical protein